MKRQIRTGLFESNSSSAHVIVVTKNDVHVTSEELENWDTREHIYIDKDGKWDLCYGNIEDGFGRYPFMILSTFKDKFEYVICNYMGYSWHYETKAKERFEEYEKKLEEIAKKYINGFVKFRFSTAWTYYLEDENGNPNMDIEVDYDYKRDEYSYTVWERNKSKEVIVKEDDVIEVKVPVIGTIDHQSSGMLSGFLNKHNIDLEEFLTNKKYIIIVDGDEYDFYGKAKESGLIDKSIIVEEYGYCNND